MNYNNFKKLGKQQWKKKYLEKYKHIIVLFRLNF